MNKKILTVAILFIELIFVTCSSNKLGISSRLDGTYVWQDGMGVEYMAFIKSDTLNMYRDTCYLYEEDCDSCSHLIASAKLSYYHGFPGVILNSLPIRPFDNLQYSFNSTDNDSATITLRFPNYDFSKGFYPIMKLASYYFNGEPGDSDYIEPTLYHMTIECKTDSVVAILPRTMMGESLYLDIYQSKYNNEHSASLPTYLGAISFHWEILPYLEDHLNENCTITFPNVSNQIFELMCLEEFCVPYNENELNFCTWRMLKISSDFVKPRKKRTRLYNDYILKHPF